VIKGETPPPEEYLSLRPYGLREFFYQANVGRTRDLDGEPKI